MGNNYIKGNIFRGMSSREIIAFGLGGAFTAIGIGALLGAFSVLFAD